MVTEAPDAQLQNRSRQALLLRIRRGARFVVVAGVVWVVVLAIAAIFFGDRALVARFERTGPSIVAMTFCGVRGEPLAQVYAMALDAGQPRFTRS